MNFPRRGGKHHKRYKIAENRAKLRILGEDYVRIFRVERRARLDGGMENGIFTADSLF
jgi:hypothetical protein